MKSSFHLFNAFGIPVKADLSLIILALLMMGQWGNPFYDLIACVLLLASIVLHELGHSLVAMAFGCRVRDITLMIIGGCATLETMPRKAWQELLVALAGPAVSLALGVAGIWMFAPHAVSTYNGMAYAFRSPFAQMCFYSFGWGNLVLFLFNLIPAFPMDGGRVLRAILQQFFTTRLKATWIASRIGRFIAMLFVAGVILELFGYTVPFVGGKLNMLLIAFFIYTSADREYRMVLAEEGDRTANPFASFFGQRPGTSMPPPDDGKVYVSPPPYKRHGGERVDLKREDDR